MSHQTTTLDQLNLPPEIIQTCIQGNPHIHHLTLHSKPRQSRLSIQDSIKRTTKKDRIDNRETPGVDSKRPRRDASSQSFIEETPVPKIESRRSASRQFLQRGTAHS
jgi:hypothetical protein